MDRNSDWRAVVEGYVDYVFNLLDDLDDSGDLVKQVVERLEKFIQLASESRRPVMTPGGRVKRRKVEAILEFLRSAPREHVAFFEERLRRRVRGRNRKRGEMETIVEELRKHSELLGVYVPVDLIEYDPLCYKGDCTYMVKIGIGTRTYIGGVDGSFEDLIDALKKTLEDEAVKIYELASRSLRERRRVLKTLPGLKDLLGEIESHVAERASLAIGEKRLYSPAELLTAWEAGMLGPNAVWNVERARFGEEEIIVYGSNPKQWPEFYKQLVKMLREGPVSIVLEIPLREIDEGVGLPVKGIRGFVAWIESGAVKYIQATPTPP